MEFNACNGVFDMAVKKTKKTAKKTVKTAKKAASTAKKTAGTTTTKTKIFFETMENPMSKSNKSFEKIAQEANAIGQEQMDALMKSTQIFTKGMEEIVKTCMDLAQNSAAKSQEAAQNMMACKTLNEFTEAQTKFAQTSFDEFMSNATKMSEMSVKMATEAMEPINDQLGKAMKKASESMAA